MRADYVRESLMYGWAGPGWQISGVAEDRETFTARRSIVRCSHSPSGTGRVQDGEV